VATFLAACGDSTAPQAVSPSTPTVADAPRPSFDILGFDVPLSVLGDTTYATFTVKPDQARTFVFDRHSAITFPAHAICKQGEGYGPTMWDKPCDPTTRDYTITVKSYRGLDGHVNTEFSPAIRFNPRTAGVFLYLEDYEGAVPLWNETILYCNDLRVCVDESIADGSLKTFRDAATGLYGRRIKHFSGYMVGVGRSEEAF
jgi:hypothetical protein